MYTKQEISKQKQAFWTAFGRYMQPIQSADGIEVTWVNYKTGIPGIYFRMDADNKQAEIAIVLSQADTALQQQYYDRLLQHKGMLEETLAEKDWLWQPGIQDDYGKIISKVSKSLNGVNIHRNEDWPNIISFLKPRIVALDEFWSMARYGFEDVL